MKHSMRIAVVALAILCGGCSQHGDLPTRQTYISPPAITNLTIEDNEDGTYRIDWSVADDTAVAFYRVYVPNQTGGWSVQGETTDMFYGIDLLSRIGEFPIGIASVTVQNVEGAMAVIRTPAP